MSGRVDVSIAICTWNRAALLDQTLHGLGRLVVPAGLSWELVVVDNNSPDHTQQVLARHLAAGVLPLRVGFEPTQGLCHARNRCLDLVRGDLLLWTDDDVLVDPGWLGAFAAAAARHPAAAAFGGPVEPWFPVPPDPDLLAACGYLRTGYCGIDHGPPERELPAGLDVYGVNMGFRLARVAGMRFDPGLGVCGSRLTGGDDIEFLNRARDRGPVVWVPDMRLRHYVAPERMTFGYVERFIADRATVPDRPEAGPRLFGAPRWLYRKYLAAVVAGWVSQARGRRAAWVQARVDRWRLAALIREYRRAAKTGGAA